MQDKVTYEYAVIRLVPKVEREEFMNIGVILFSKKKKYLGIKFNIDKRRIASFSADVEVEMIRDYVDAWALVCAGDPEGGDIGKLELSLRFRWLVACRSTIIQSSRTHPGLCTDPEKVLGDIFERLVL